MAWERQLRACMWHFFLSEASLPRDVGEDGWNRSRGF